MRLSILCCFALAVPSMNAVEYFVSPDGDDARSGRSAQQAWRSVAKVNATAFAPGSVICFAGGQRFPGGIVLDAADAGTATAPVVLTSYGEGRAVIEPGAEEHGIHAVDCGGLEIRDLVVRGVGLDANTRNGVYLYAEKAPARLAHVRIQRLEVTGFGDHGVLFGADDNARGYHDVLISEVDAHHNGLAGISSWGDSATAAVGWAHSAVRVERCRAWSHPGKTGRSNHSGSGIVLGGIDGAVIERCVAWDNGARCDFPGGGPVGIWAWDCRKVLIQYNESHHNRTGNASVDGGGFDFDGGVTDSLMQYNYSHDNDGAGYLICQYANARPFRDNIVRYNLSVDDGQAHGYGAIHFHTWKSGDLGACQILFNTVIATRRGRGNPACVRFTGGTCTGIVLAGNLFVAGADIPHVDCVFPDPGARFLGNAYVGATPALRITWAGATHGDLAAWRAASGQERDGGVDRGESWVQDIVPGEAPVLANIADFAPLARYAATRPSAPLADVDQDGQSQDLLGSALPRPRVHAGAIGAGK
ncbi:MAG: right-handed parallel beta-helix repeat-containing protein [Planctomycetes bacterium]|nr:right-handed parallel beta-helix repeat-containing protein [Planctomycetota bacterium]